MKKTAIVLGSANAQRDTYEDVAHLMEYIDAELYNLSEYKVGPFDYTFKNKDDDFLPLISQIINDHDQIILASPVYWYSVSAQLKAFIDRLSDLLKTHKDLGRQLRGKSLGLLSRSHGNDCPPEYSMPIQRSADYLGMQWIGHIHFFDEGPSAIDLSRFVDKVNA